MIKYRDHRGTLEDSLATTKEFNTIYAVLGHIRDNLIHKPPGFELTDFKIEWYGYDSRCKQNLYIVTSQIGVHGFIFEDLG